MHQVIAFASPVLEPCFRRFSGYTLYFCPPSESGRSGSWKNLETHEQHGWLRLERTGNVLKFLAGDDASMLTEIGQVEFGTAPIETVAVRVVVPATTSKIDVALETSRSQRREN